MLAIRKYVRMLANRSHAVFKKQLAIKSMLANRSHAVFKKQLAIKSVGLILALKYVLMLAIRKYV
ncbi:hypothetical protein C8F01DRAFT_1257716 [Mycena amicta]|nr:hypothetical protein C8F01DRAFT_1257716 [Mycena amicta]